MGESGREGEGNRGCVYTYVCVREGLGLRRVGAWGEGVGREPAREMGREGGIEQVRGLIVGGSTCTSTSH